METLPPYFSILKRHFEDWIRNPPKDPREHQIHQKPFISAPENYKFLLNLMKSVNTKRLLFDARQISIFDKSGTIEVEGVKLAPPFQDSLYVELSEPIEIESKEPGFPADKLVSIFYLHNCSEIKVLTKEGFKYFPASMAIFIFWDGKSWCDRAFRLNLDMKTPFVAVGNVRRTTNPSEVPGEWLDLQWFISEDFPNRKIGFWEESVKDYTDILCWMFAYCLCKSVKIEEIKLSRQLRRAYEREGYLPNPWHKIFIKPKIYTHNPAAEDSGRHLRYIHSVLNHLRFNRHRLRDGSYRHTIELVPDHFRGLNSGGPYIPSTYVAKGSVKPLKEMESYWGKDVFPPTKKLNT